MKKYSESHIFERKVLDLLRIYPIKDHAEAWLEFCRTVGSTLHVIEKEALTHAQDR